uniref:hypothetical protein n=1 Tax=Altererythrobacter segetis TaxID=1104773 RepID=UPI0014083524|nr:hypothetical protein [Altererythrobacter segetis]
MNRTLRAVLVATSAATALGAEPALAANCANVSFSPGAPATITYDPIKATQSATTTFTATLSGFASNDKKYILILTDADTGTPLRIGTTGPIYTITSGATTVSFPKNTTAVSSGVAQSDKAVTSPSFTVALPVNSSGQDFVGGTQCTENLGYSLQCFFANGNSSGADTGSAVSLTTSIASVLSIVTASPQTLNFGNFTTTSQTLQVSLKSTSTMSVSVSTVNGSQMVLNGAVSPFPTNSTIPYTMTFAGSAITAGSPQTVSRAGVGGNTFAFALTLPGGVPSGKLPGTYADVITLTIVPGP